jgi:hypothetical protein
MRGLIQLTGLMPLVQDGGREWVVAGGEGLVGIVEGRAGS